MPCLGLSEWADVFIARVILFGSLKYLALALQQSGGAKPYASSSDLEARSRKEDRV
jgi:hypothetical protein